MTPTTSPPAARAASATVPMSPTCAPPYTSPMPRSAIRLPRLDAVCRYIGCDPLLDPQNTQILRSGFGMYFQCIGRGSTYDQAPRQTQCLHGESGGAFLR